MGAFMGHEPARRIADARVGTKHAFTLESHHDGAGENTAAHGDLRDLSFDTISAFGPNGALPHYKGTAESNLPFTSGTLYLVDSGGQYQDGTTDITRTVPIGEPTAEMIDRNTRVLQGHIAIATALFPKGTRGSQLDSFARRPLWEAGCDYAHGAAIQDCPDGPRQR